MNNQKLNDVLLEHWNSRQMQRAISLTSSKFEPALVKITERMFGTPETRISPNFARVLRNQVLRKDMRWFTVRAIETGGKSQIKTTIQTQKFDFEFGITGNDNPFKDEMPPM